MCNQLLEEITQNVTKNPNWEEYFLQQYFDDIPDNKYHHLHFTEVCETDVNGDDWYSSGITDSEIIDVLINRLKSNKINIKLDDVRGEILKEYFISTLETLQELING